MITWLLALTILTTAAALLGLLPMATLRGWPAAKCDEFRAALSDPERLEDLESWLARHAAECDRCAYEHLGALADGTQVLRATSRGNGSAAIERLIFLRVSSVAATRPDGQPCERTLVQSAASFALGERDEASIEVMPERVWIGASRNRPQPVVLAFGN